MEAHSGLSAQDKRTLGLSSLGAHSNFMILSFMFLRQNYFRAILSNWSESFLAMLNTYGIFAAGYFSGP